MSCRICTFDEILLIIHILLLYDSEMINVLIKTVAAKGYNTFIQILSIFDTESQYKQFVESVILFYSVHQNAEYIKTSVDVNSILVVLTKHNLKTYEEAQTLSDNDKLLELMKLKSLNFHRQFLECIFQPSFCILHIKIRRCITQMQKEICEFKNALNFSALVPNSNQLASENVFINNDTLTSSSAAFSSSSITTYHEENSTRCQRPTLDQFRGHLLDKPTFQLIKPTFQQLVEHVIPLYASHWKTLGILLGVPDYQLENIEKS